MADLWVKRGDTAPALRAQLTDNGEPLDLADADVSFVMRPIRSASPTITSDEVTLLPADTFDPPELGWVEYQWAEGDTDVAGGYYAEFPCEIGGQQATFPNDRHIKVAILDDIEVEEEES